MTKEEIKEQVQQIPISEIRPFKNHPFKVLDDELMQQTVESIKQAGVLNPTIIRPVPEGGYEMVAGHRRQHAAELAGLDTIPAIVRNLSDDEAVILMVDSNLQRETITPMERAQAYKMKLEALKHQGKRIEVQGDATSPQIGEKSSWAVSIVANDAGASRSQVQRFIRLTELIIDMRMESELNILLRLFSERRPRITAKLFTVWTLRSPHICSVTHTLRTSFTRRLILKPFNISQDTKAVKSLWIYTQK